MYELIQAGERTYYIDAPAKIGIYRVSDTEVWLIDSGNDKDAARRICKILDAQGWSLAGVVNTHSNADHIGGNAGLVKRTGCKIIGTGLENAFTRYPLLEPSFLYGGYPMKTLRNKFLMAEESAPCGAVETDLPEGLEYIDLKGHFFDMCGIRTNDDVVFLADCVFGAGTIDRYHVFFVYDVAAFLKTLDRVETMKARLFVPSHAPATDNIGPLVRANRKKVLEIAGLLQEICAHPRCFDEILKQVFDHYGLAMDMNQYVLVGSTVRSYLSYLCDQGRMEVVIRDNLALFSAIS